MPAQANGVIAITSCEDLQKIGKTLPSGHYPLNGHYVLTADVDMTGCLNTESLIGSGFDNRDRTGWAPIGRSLVDFSTWTPPPAPLPSDDTVFDGAFTGTLDGNGHTIKGLYVNRQYLFITDVGFFLVSSGLFGALDGAAVKNLNIEADTVAVYNSHSLRTAASGILAGFSRNSAITNVNVTGTVIGYVPVPANRSDFNMHAGGLIGRSLLDSISRSSAAVTIISGDNTPTTVVKPIDKIRVGGLVGTSMLSKISRSSAVTEINGESRSAGGLAGENLGGTIHRSSAEVTAGQSIRIMNVGGLAGINTFFTPECPENIDCDIIMPIYGTITESYSQINISANNNSSNILSAGGLVGHHYKGSIANCYSIGSIELPLLLTLPSIPAAVMGGSVGRLEDPEASPLFNSYAAVALAGGNRRGAVIGQIIGDLPVSFMPWYHHCYWNTDLVTGDAGGHGTGVTTAQMRQQNTFVTLANWDFHNIWRIDEGESYPYFAWQDTNSTSISRGRAAGSISKNISAPTVTLRGKMLNVNTSSSAANLQIRLIDMRGRTMTRFNTTGSGSFSLNKISAGRYIVDMRDMDSGKRFTSPIVLR